MEGERNKETFGEIPGALIGRRRIARGAQRQDETQSRSPDTETETEIS